MPFVGREPELARLDASSARILYVHAPAGEGKTALIKQWLARRTEPVVFFDDWTPEQDLALLEESTRIVVASRHAPSLQLRAAAPDMLVLPLEPLAMTDARALVTHVPSKEAQDLLAFAQGHALTLAVLASKSNAGEERRLLGQLLDAFIGGVSSEDRLALEAIAPLRFVSEAQLRRAVGVADPSLFERLRRQSFVRPERLGLSLHPALRELLLDDLLWRHPERARELVRAELPVLRDELAATGPIRERAIEILVDLIAHAPKLWISRGALIQHASIVTPEARPEVVELVRLHEGDESAAICARWLEAFPERSVLARDEEGRVAAMAIRGVIDRSEVPELRDPLLDNVLRELDGADVLLINRFFCGRTMYQALVAEIAPVLEWLIRDTIVTNHQAHLTVVREGPTWAPMIATGLFPVLAGSETTIGEHRYLPLGAALPDPSAATSGFLGMVAQSWGTEPPAIIAAQPMPTNFETEVRAALIAMSDPIGLESLELATTLGITDGAALQALLRSAVDELHTMPNGDRVQRALQARQGLGLEDAAASVAMSLATYKRHWKRGEERVAEILWRARKLNTRGR